jgi:ribonucleoside-diphosphate reductase alpha chain
MLDKIRVTKRNGNTEDFNIEKVHQVLMWSVEDITGVSVSEIEIKAEMQFYNDIETSEIHEALIKSAADLISEDSPNYQFVAARLTNYTLRKQVYNQYNPPTIISHIKQCIAFEVYDSNLLSLYGFDEWEKIEKIVKHERDDLLSYAAIEQFRGKYLVQNRTTNTFYETPQMAYILIAAILFNKYDSSIRLKYVRDYYDAISMGPKSTITLPTPILAGVRTPTRQFSSCVLIDCDDSLESINECASSVVDYASRRAGIGLNLGKIRAKGSPVKGGEVFHTGNIPFYKYFQSALKSCSQGGIRGASATIYFPLWHSEAEDLLVLKNNKGTEETRVRHMDYGVQMNGFLLQRLIDGKNITLFNPLDVPDLYDAFFEDQELFAELYEKYERAWSVQKHQLSAMELFNTVIIERNNTGRLYIQFVDHGNTHSSFNTKTSPIKQSNLCIEITLPTHGLTSKSRLEFTNDIVEKLKDITVQNFRAEYGEIALCTLSSINLGAIHSPDEFQKPCELAIRALDELLDYQGYPMVAAGYPAINRRSLGVGVCNLAYFIAKHGNKYSDGSANDLVNEYIEAMSYWLISASNILAKEKGPCGWFDETKYSKGILPIDTYKKEVDNTLTTSHYLDWTKLRDSVSKHGMRNSTVMAIMPVESSSQVINATNGIEPPRSNVSVKASKNGTLKQVVPEIHRFKNKYEYLWDMPNNKGYLELAAIIQKWTDQAISTNTSYNPNKYPGNKITTSILIEDLIYSYKLGIKGLYYQNTSDGSGDVYEEESDCASCKL